MKTLRTLDAAMTVVVPILADALRQMEEAVPGPGVVLTASGYPSYRYVEKTAQQAIVLKTVRILSALLAAKQTLDAGLVLDVGASMRILDELGSDVLFLSGPLLFGSQPEPRHAKFLEEFFQEEFDHEDPLRATQRRNRVSRSDVRAYVARTYSIAGAAVSDIVTVTETIDNAFSGYIHGAAVHIMEVFDGRGFRVPVGLRDQPRITLANLFQQYLHRAVMTFEAASKALGLDELNGQLHALSVKNFDPHGDLR